MDYLKTFTDKRGSLTLLEFEKQVPFTVTRVYWIYDVHREKSVENMQTGCLINI